MTDSVAMAIYWAAFEMYPPDARNPVSRVTKEQAWQKTSEEHRRLARFQAQRAVEAYMSPTPTVGSAA